MLDNASLDAPAVAEQLGVNSNRVLSVPLTLSQWELCMAMSSVVLWLSELRKFLLRRKDAIQQATTIDRALLGF